MDITIYYIDIRIPDKGNEEYYRRIRDFGITMIRGKVGEVIEDSETHNLKIRGYSTLTNRIIKEDADLIVLSTGIVLSKGTEELIDIIGLSKGPDGFLSEIHSCLKPQETKNMGIYICGCAAGPKNIPYSVSSALAAASKVSTLLSNDIIFQELIIAEVDKNLCMSCHRCEKLCEYQAIKVNDEGFAQVDNLKCKGCGVCVTVCPARAVDLKYYRDKQLIEEIKGIANYEIEFIHQTQKIIEK
jgi:heterodisulfide reductase subunit A